MCTAHLVPCSLCACRLLLEDGVHVMVLCDTIHLHTHGAVPVLGSLGTPCAAHVSATAAAEVLDELGGASDPDTHNRLCCGAARRARLQRSGT